jgi:outer membrane murein-binding lipoprotein Lpp
MKYLTFLDYGTVESEGRSYEAKAKQLEKDNDLLKAHVRHLEAKIDDLYNQMESMVGDETRAVRRGAAATRRVETATEKAVQSQIKYTEQLQDFAVNMKKILSQKEMTQEQKDLLGSIFESMYNAAVESQGLLKNTQA